MAKIVNKLNPYSVNSLRKNYPEGTRVRLIRMNDVQAPPKGTMGEIIYIDDLGTIHVNWENGSSLGLIATEDIWETIR